MEINNIQKSNILNFVAGFMQSTTFILAYILWKYFPQLSITQNLILGGMIVTNEALVYIFMRMGSILIKQ